MIPPFLVRPAIYLVVVAGLFFGGVWTGWTKRGEKEVHKALESQIAAERVRQAVEDRWRGAVYDLSYQAEQKREQREQEHQATVAGLRSGALQLRSRFKCPAVSENPSAAGEPATEESGFRREDALTALGISDEADQIADERNQCIASYNALRVKP